MPWSEDMLCIFRQNMHGNCKTMSTVMISPLLMYRNLLSFYLSVLVMLRNANEDLLWRNCLWCFYIVFFSFFRGNWLEKNIHGWMDNWITWRWSHVKQVVICLPREISAHQSGCVYLQVEEDNVLQRGNVLEALSGAANTFSDPFSISQGSVITDLTECDFLLATFYHMLFSLLSYFLSESHSRLVGCVRRCPKVLKLFTSSSSMNSAGWLHGTARPDADRNHMDLETTITTTQLACQKYDGKENNIW